MTELRKAAEQRIGMERPERGSVGFQEALGLADWLDAFNDGEQYAITKSAAELRRLHKENQTLRQTLAQPEQDQYVTKVVAMHEDGTYTTEQIPLPKREWVGLTDEEIDGIYKTHHDQYGKCQTGGFDYERSIEAKLKEKNA